MAEHASEPNLVVRRISAHVLKESEAKTTHFNMDGSNVNPPKHHEIREGLVILIAFSIRFLG